MKKFIFKSVIFSLIFGGIFFGMYIAVLAWTGLQASNGDKLTMAKWNELVNYVTGLSGSISNSNKIYSMNRTGIPPTDNAIHLIPGLTKTLVLTKDTDIYISANGSARVSATGMGAVFIYIYVDGTEVTPFTRILVGNSSYSDRLNRTTSGLLNLTTGTHTIEVRGMSYNQAGRLGAYRICSEYNGTITSASNCNLTLQVF